MKTEQKTPTLRFPEFEGEWEEKKLGEIANSIASGKTKAAEIGEYPVYGSMGIIGYSSSYTHQDEHILVARVGANAGRTFYVNEKFSITDNTLVIDVNKENLTYISYYIPSLNIERLAFGSGQPLITASILKSLKISFPSLPEQQKIADFLSATDKRLELLKEKKLGLEDYKRGTMQRIFSQELRFTRPDGSAYEDWEEKKLGEMLIEVSEKTTSNNQFNAISSTAKGLFLQSDYFTREIASKNNIGYKILSLNQLVFSPQNLWLGNINVNLNFEKGIVSPSYKIYSFEKNILDVLFASYIMKTKELLYEYILCSEMGASVVRRNLNIDLFLKIKINLPSLEEQTQIANFLSAIDVKIEKLSEQIEATENYKKGLLQQMFV